MGSLKLVNLLLLLGFVSRISSTEVTVKTNVGYLVGFREDVEFNNTVMPIAKFLGIPYAEPPVGLWRFRNPRPKAPFVQQLRVQEFGSRCLEVPAPGPEVGSEDCLYLNIYAPDRMKMESLAVMVFIHGGAFATGSGQDYDSDLLAAVGHTIIVTINYRLNVWGFLSTDDHNSYGNYGLRDQQLAIQWVHDNIEAFGGDNNRITIFGESAGAASVIYQGLYPGNEGLFQRIIAQSGSASAPWASSPSPTNSTVRLAQETGCYNDSVMTMVECLRYLPESRIRAAVIKLSSQLLVSFGPTIDNTFVTCKPADVLNLDLSPSMFESSRNMLASVDLMIGLNSRDGGLAVNPMSGFEDPETFMPNKTYFDNVMTPLLVKYVYGNTINNSIARDVSAAIARNYTDVQDPENPYRIREQFVAMNGDVQFLAPTQTTVDLHAKSSKMTYVYYLSVNPTSHLLPTPSWVEGANHADDLMFIFQFPNIAFNDQEKELAKQMVSWWTNFAKTGNPNQPGDVGVTWEPYTEAKHYYLDLTTNMTSQNLKQGLHEDKSAFWNTEVPAIIGAETEVCDNNYSTSNAPSMVKGCVFLVISVVFLLFF